MDRDRTAVVEVGEQRSLHVYRQASSEDSRSRSARTRSTRSTFGPNPMDPRSLREETVEHAERTLVCCKACGAMRCIELVSICFCKETAHKPAPPPKDEELRLFDEETYERS